MMFGLHTCPMHAAISSKGKEEVKVCVQETRKCHLFTYRFEQWYTSSSFLA